MKIASSDIMNKIDNYCIQALSIPRIVLMENAGLKVIKNLNTESNNIFTVICGSGNNGGDGFAVSRHLFIMGKKVNVFLIGNEGKLSHDCRINYDILNNLGVEISYINNTQDLEFLRECITKSDLTIDAILGTELSRNVEGIYDSVISVINENSRHTVSIDIPSGLSCDTGKVLGNSIIADLTVTFELYKRGFINYGADKYTGRVVVENIGIPEAVIDKFHKNEFITDRDMIKRTLSVRNKYSYKGDYGRVLIIAGSEGYSGAAFIAAEGAVCSGAGLVTLCSDKSIQQVLSSKLTEAMTISYDDKEKLENLIRKSDAIAIGPGMGSNDFTRQLLKDVVSSAACPVVIDADGINVLKDNLSILKNSICKIVLTPHIGEMSRICGCSIDYIKENRIKVPAEFARKFNVTVLLKGYNTVITDGNTTFINPTGNSAMASGGMGDCLTGIIASLIGQGCEPLIAAGTAAYIHGYCGQKLSEDMFCVNATHILENISYCMKELQK